MTTFVTPTTGSISVTVNLRSIPSPGKALTNESKYDGPQHVIYSRKWDVRENNGYTFQSDQWFAVDGNVQDGSSWSYLGEY